MVSNYKLNVIKFIPWLLVVVLVLVLWLKHFNTVENIKKEENFHQMIVDRIESMGKLEVVKYSFKDILEHKRNSTVWGVGISSKTLLIIGAEAVACVDLTKISVADIDSSGGRLRVRLPMPEICYVKVDHSKSKVYNTEMSVFDDAEDKLVDDAYREAESYIKSEVAKTDIVAMAKVNTEKVLKPLLASITNKNVVLEFK
jgi:hypothetical protein